MYRWETDLHMFTYIYVLCTIEAEKVGERNSTGRDKKSDSCKDCS